MRIKATASPRVGEALAGHLLVVCLIVSSFTCVYASSAQEEYLHTRELTSALGRVLLSDKATRALLRLCSENYPHLSDSVNQAHEHLTQVNNPVVNKARILQQRLVQSITTQENAFDAEKFSLEIDLAVQNTVEQFKQTLVDYPRQERHYICNRLVLSVRAGEWDVQVREPEASRMISNFE